jgi:hypothetical protein
MLTISSADDLQAIARVSDQRGVQEADDYIGEAAVARQAARMMLEVVCLCPRCALGVSNPPALVSSAGR